MEWYLLAVVFFFTLALFLLASLPVAFSLGIVSVIVLFIHSGTEGWNILPIMCFNYGTAWAFIALPLFIFMAEVMVFSGMGADTYTCAEKWLGWLPGGLGVTSIVACGAFAAACGSSTGTAVAIGLLAIPEMLKRGYSNGLASGTLAAGGTLGILIPPSAIMIIYGIITETPIDALFLAGIIPGAILVALFSLYVVVKVAFNPSLAPRQVSVSWNERLVSLRKAIGMIAIIAFIMVGLYTGICTPTELAGIGAFGALILSLIYRRLNWENLKEACINAARTSCFVFFIVFFAMTFGYVLSLYMIPHNFSQWILSLELPPLAILGMINIMLLLLGCFLEPASMLVITLPFLFPLISSMGFDPVWFGVIMTINMEMGNITPPIGLNLFVIKGISPAEVTMEEIIRGSAPFVAILAIVIAIFVLFPDLVLWLPAIGVAH